MFRSPWSWSRGFVSLDIRRYPVVYCSVGREMGGCTSASSWADGRDSTLTDALTGRQFQIVRDTWEVIISDDVQSDVWLQHLNR